MKIVDGSKIRKFMDDKLRSKEWVAAQLGISMATVERMLGGSSPRRETIIKLAQLIGCEPTDLLVTQKTRKTA